MRNAARLIAWTGVVMLAAGAVHAGVEVTFDVATINDLIASAAVQRIEVPVAGQRTVEVHLEELRVLGFRPPGDAPHQGFIQTSLKLRVPQLGVAVSVEPRLSLHVLEREGETVLELRFDRVELPLPFARINLAGLLPPIRYPADSAFLLAGAAGDVEVRSRVAGVTVTGDLLRFRIAVEVVPPGSAVPSTAGPGGR